MSRKDRIEDTAFELLSGVCDSLGLIPVDAEYVKEKDGYSLCIYIDKEGGVTIDDCEALSRHLDPLLDEADIIEDPYTMVVSSPGLGRVLRRPRDFIFGMGKEVDVKTYAPVNGEKEFTGILKAADDKSVTIETENGPLAFDKKEISTIKLTVSF